MIGGTVHYRPALGVVLGVGDTPAHARRATVSQQPAVNEAMHGRARVLQCRLVTFGQVSRIRTADDQFDEWFTRGSLYPGDDMALSLEHLALGGRRIGHVIRLYNGQQWGDAYGWVDESRAGDAVLSSISNDELLLDAVVGKVTIPVSMAFRQIPGGATEYPPIGRDGVRGVQRNAVEILEVAIVEQAAIKGAQVIARVTPTAISQLAASK